MKFLETCNPNAISDDNYSLANHDRSRHQVTFTFNCGKRPHRLKLHQTFTVIMKLKHSLNYSFIGLN